MHSWGLGGADMRGQIPQSDPQSRLPECWKWAGFWGLWHSLMSQVKPHIFVVSGEKAEVIRNGIQWQQERNHLAMALSEIPRTGACTEFACRFCWTFLRHAQKLQMVVNDGWNLRCSQIHGPHNRINFEEHEKIWMVDYSPHLDIPLWSSWAFYSYEYAEWARNMHGQASCLIPLQAKWAVRTLISQNIGWKVFKDCLSYLNNMLVMRGLYRKLF